MSVELVAQAWTPLCMEPDELASWRAFNARTGAGRAGLPCADCLPSFSAEMHAAKSPDYPDGRCNGTPRGGQEETQMDQPATSTPPRSMPVARRVALDVAAPPCPSCAHEPVCGLRAALEGIAEVETTAPALPHGLRLSLAATVECDHFLRDRAKPAPVRVLTSEQRGQANRKPLSDAQRTTMAANAARARAGLVAKHEREGAAAG